MGTHEPRLYQDIPLHLATYLHRVAGFPDPLQDMAGQDVGVYIAGWEDAPDTALNIVGPWEYDRDSETVPTVRFLIAHRAPTLQEVWVLQHHTFTTLEQPQRFELTADTELRYCRRVVSDPPVPDQNGRQVIVDTYECRPYRQSNLGG